MGTGTVMILEAWAKLQVVVLWDLTGAVIPTVLSVELDEMHVVTVGHVNLPAVPGYALDKGRLVAGSLPGARLPIALLLEVERECHGRHTPSSRAMHDWLSWSMNVPQ
jgi:hypothetical protein